MTMVLDEEQELLRRAVRDLLDDRADSRAVRAAMDGDTGRDPELWRRLGSDLGVLGLTVGEEHGGAGAGHVERAVVAEELGRALVPSPFFGSSVLAIDTIDALDDDTVARDLLPGLAEGSTLGAVAVAEPGDRALSPDATRTTAVRRDDAWTITGTKTPVIDGAAADVLMVYAGSEDGPAFFRVDADASSVARVPLTTLDRTRRMCRIEFSDAPATRIEGDAAAALAQVADLAAVALGAEQVGGMQRVLSMTVDYAKVRVQFGRPIGSYQAVKHGLADMYAAHELAYSALRQAAWAADHDRDALPLAAALLTSYAGPAFFAAARDAVQFHGGIGYTWEHDAGLYYRRAKSDELLLGSPGEHRGHLAELLAI